MSHKITYENTFFQANNDANLLELLLENDAEINYACKAGNCQSCLIKCTKGSVPDKAQKGLKETLKTQGYLLACQCDIQSDMVLTQKGVSHLRSKVTVLSVSKITKKLLLLRLSIPKDFIFEPGQSLIIWKNKKEGRNYSIASIREDNYLELHIKKYDNGALSAWLFNDIKIDDVLEIQGPSGHCFYTQTNTPLLLIGNGTGLSPLLGIIKEAIKKNHSEPIRLIHYARDNSQLYYQKEINRLTQKHSNITFETLVKDEKSHKTIVELSKDSIKKNKQQTIFLAGSDGLVNLLRKQLYIAGASLSSIHSDAFIPHGKGDASHE